MESFLAVLYWGPIFLGNCHLSSGFAPLPGTITRRQNCKVSREDGVNNDMPYVIVDGLAGAPDYGFRV